MGIDVNLRAATGNERGGICLLGNPWPGRAVEVVPTGQPAERIAAAERLRLETRPGDTLTLRAASTTP